MGVGATLVALQMSPLHGTLPIVPSSSDRFLKGTHFIVLARESVIRSDKNDRKEGYG
jgi:hypothetical protein